MADAKVDIFMPLYISDYDRDTADLSFEEHGFYGAILRALWTRGGVLQAHDKQKLSRILRTDEATVTRLWPSVERFFVVRPDGSFHQKRLTFELEKAKRHKEIAVARARKGGLARATSAASSDATSGAQSQLEASLGASTSPSPSGDPDLPPASQISRPDPERARVKAPTTWTAGDWCKRFGSAWTVKYRSFYGMASDGPACGKLADLLERMPEIERIGTQVRAADMFAGFLASAAPAVVKARHPFAWFVTEFGGLRVPEVEASPGGVRGARKPKELPFA